jgi:hypothetical protein
MLVLDGFFGPVRHPVLSLLLDFGVRFVMHNSNLVRLLDSGYSRQVGERLCEAHSATASSAGTKSELPALHRILVGSGQRTTALLVNTVVLVVGSCYKYSTLTDDELLEGLNECGWASRPPSGLHKTRVGSWMASDSFVVSCCFPTTRCPPHISTLTHS